MREVTSRFLISKVSMTDTMLWFIHDFTQEMKLLRNFRLMRICSHLLKLIWIRCGCQKLAISTCSALIKQSQFGILSLNKHQIACWKVSATVQYIVQHQDHVVFEVWRTHVSSGWKESYSWTLSQRCWSRLLLHWIWMIRLYSMNMILL